MYWQKCARCGVYYDIQARLTARRTAELCPKCWKYLPHYRLTKGAIKTKAKIKEKEVPFDYILLYILGCSLCLLVIAYYLWIN